MGILAITLALPSGIVLALCSVYILCQSRLLKGLPGVALQAIQRLLCFRCQV